MSKSVWSSLSLGLSGLALLAPRLPAQCAVRENLVLLGEDTAGGDELGVAVALSGSAAIVGMGRFSTLVEGAYLFRRGPGGWVQERKILSEIPDSCNFGEAVAIDGDVAVIGDWAREAGGFCKGSGAATIYRHDGEAWGKEQEIVGPLSVIAYGWSLALRGDVLLGGAPGQNPPVQQPPRVLYHRYDGSQWQLAQTIAGSDTQTGDSFGSAVAISRDGTRAVVGASSAKVNGVLNQGAAYVFRFDGASWIEEQKLVAGDGATNEAFGASVAIDGDVVVVGAPQDTTTVFGAGSFYVYRFDGTQWSETQNIASSSPGSSNRFASSLALDGGRLVAGDRAVNRAYLYRDTGGAFRLVQRMRPSSEGPLDWFGRSVALDGDRVLVGAPFASVAGGGSGASYVFTAHDLLLSGGEVPPPGGRLTLTVCGGLPGARGHLTASIGRTSSPLRLPTLGLLQRLSATFDGEGRASFQLVIPPGLSGRSFRLQALGPIRAGVVGRSNVLTVRVP